MQRALIRIRPLLVHMRLVDCLKQRWDAKSAPSLKRLFEEVVAKGNLSEVISSCDDLFKEYKERILRLTSLEEFLRELSILEAVAPAAGANLPQALEEYLLSHFLH